MILNVAPALGWDRWKAERDGDRRSLVLSIEIQMTKQKRLEKNSRFEYSQKNVDSLLYRENLPFLIYIGDVVRRYLHSTVFYGCCRVWCSFEFEI